MRPEGDVKGQMRTCCPQDIRAADMSLSPRIMSLESLLPGSSRHNIQEMVHRVDSDEVL